MQQKSYLKCPCESCGGNIEFPAQAVDQSIPCPHCGENTRLSQPVELPPLSNRKRFRPAHLVIAICIILGTAMAIGILAAKKSAESVEVVRAVPQIETETKIETKEPDSKNKRRKKANVKPIKAASEIAKEWNGLTTTGISLEKTDNSRLIYAIGTVHNKTDHQRFGVKVELDLFDAQNAKIGSATDYIQVIEPHKDWRFKALVIDPKAVRAEIAGFKEN
jgi:hypothetical protein